MKKSQRTIVLPVLALGLGLALVGRVAAQDGAADPHHPAEGAAAATTAPPAAAADSAPPAAGTQPAIPPGSAGLATATPMCPMMMMGGPGMTGSGAAGPGMMGAGMMGAGMMGAGMMGAGMTSPGMMPGAMMQEGMGPGLLYGMPPTGRELTVDAVRAMLERQLAWHANPRLKLGKVEADQSAITAEIVTVDGSLVQKLAFDRFPGPVRQVQ